MITKSNQNTEKLQKKTTKKFQNTFEEFKKEQDEKEQREKERTGEAIPDLFNDLKEGMENFMNENEKKLDKIKKS